MARITGILGLSGSAKTLVMANMARKDYLKGKRIFANFHLEFDGEHKSFSERQKEGSLNYYPLFEPKDLKKIKMHERNIALYLDELNSWGVDESMKGGVDSYDYKSESALIISNFFKTKLRKMHTECKYTAQQLKLIPVRVREETEFVIKPKILSWVKQDDPIHPYRPHQIMYITKRLDEETGNYFQIEKSLLTHPLGYNTITEDMVKIYNTDSDIISVKDRGRSNISESESPDGSSGTNDPFRNPVTDEELYQYCKKNFNHGTFVEKLFESGRYSLWKGDIMLTPPGKSPVILDAIGTHKFNSDGITSQSLVTRNKYEAFQSMAEVDTIQKSKHYIAFYNKRITKKDNIVKDWYVAPLDKNLSMLKARDKTPAIVKELTDVIQLKDLVL